MSVRLKGRERERKREREKEIYRAREKVLEKKRDRLFDDVERHIEGGTIENAVKKTACLYIRKERMLYFFFFFISNIKKL